MLQGQVPSHSKESEAHSEFNAEEVACQDDRQISSLGRTEVGSRRAIGQSILEALALGDLIPGAESCVVFLYDLIQQQFCPQATVNLSSGFVDAIADKEHDERLIARAVEQSAPYLLVHLLGDNLFKSIRVHARREGIHTLWLIPWYRRDGGPLGVFIFASKQAFSPGKQALAAAALLTELMSVGQAIQSQESVRADEGPDEEIPYPFAILGKDTKDNASRAQEDEHGIQAIYHGVAQKQSKRAEPDAVSVLSHELLSPLTLIKGYAATLLQLAEVITEEQSKQYLQGIQAATDRVIRLLENLRDISRLDIRAPNLLLQPSPVPDLLRKAVSEIQGQTTEHVIKLQLPGSLPLVNLDRQKMEQVLTNLLTNAVKYSPQGGDIEVIVWLATSELEVQAELERVPPLRYPCLIVSVSDSGIGIPESVDPCHSGGWSWLTHLQGHRGSPWWSYLGQQQSPAG
jgi:signal transduction histidine kinase